MVAGLFAIGFGIVLLAISRAWADNMANKFRQLGSEMDPAFFRVAIGILGLAGVIFGIVKMASALR